MSSLAVSEVRSRVASALADLDGWTESRWAYGLFGSESDHLLHHSFAVGVEDTVLHPRAGQQKLHEGALVVTTVQVQWAHRLRQDAQVADYGAALDSEAQAIVKLLSVDRRVLHVLFSDARRRTTEEGWLLGTMRFRAIHQLALR
ncbi:MAG: hypothetical protein H6739_29415 [Alphaproteobacteria bacterium]|nr:hypothetical protein [Alphaproteobacteria bacterium]